MIEEPNFTFFEENYQSSIRLICLSPLVDVLDLIDAVQRQTNDTVTHYYVEHGESFKHLSICFANKQSVNAVVSNRFVFYNNAKLLAKIIRKQKQKVVKPKKNKKADLELKNVFPSDRIQNLLQSTQEIHQLLAFSRDTFTVYSKSNSNQAIRDVLYASYGKVQASNVLDFESVSVMEALHRISTISTIFSVEQAPYLNGEYLAHQFLKHIPKVTTYRPPIVKHYFVSRSFDQITQQVDIDKLTTVINQKLDEIRPSDIQNEIKQKVLHRLEEILSSSQHFSSYKPFIYGSAGTDFCQANSDFDVALISKEELSLPLETKLELLKELLGRQSDFEELHIYGGQKPVLKSNFYGSDADISFDHLVGVVNTRYLQIYSSIDSRLMQLVLLIKVWAKTRYMCESSHGNLSSYVFCLMCIFYMQQIGLLPNLQSLTTHESILPEDIANRDELILGFNCEYVSNLEKIRQIWSPSTTNSSITSAALVVGFFQFYSNFEFSKYLISPKNDGVVPLEKVAGLNNDGYSDYIFVEDPLDFRDLNKYTYPHRMHALQQEFRDTYEQLVSNRFDTLFHRVLNTTQQYHEEYKFVDENDPDVFCGKLLICDQMISVTSPERTMLINSRNNLNRTCHGDSVAVQKIHHELKVVSQLDKLTQEVVLCSTMIDRLKTFSSLDERYDPCFLSTLAIFGMEYETFVTKDVDLLLLAKRIYPWRIGKSMQAVATYLVGFKLDITAQNRALVISHYTNNYSATEHVLKAFNNTPAFYLSVSLNKDIRLALSLVGTRLIIYLPGSLSESEENDTIEKIAVEFNLEDDSYIPSEIYVVHVPRVSITESEDVEVLSELLDSMQAVDPVQTVLFNYDSCGYPVDIRSGTSVAEQIYKKVHMIIDGVPAEGNDYTQLMIKQYRRVVSKTLDSHCSFYLLAHRKSYQAIVQSIAVVGLMQIDFLIPEILQTVKCTHLPDIRNVHLVDERTIRIEFYSKEPITLSPDQHVQLNIDIDVTKSIPFNVRVSSIQIAIEQ